MFCSQNVRNDSFGKMTRMMSRNKFAADVSTVMLGTLWRWRQRKQRGIVFRMPLSWNRGRQLPLPPLQSPSHLIKVYTHRQWNIASSILSGNRILSPSNVTDLAAATSLLLQQTQQTRTVLECHSLASMQKETLPLR